jgi:hypothetical protein
MAPAEDTVQFQVNKAIKGQKVKWEFELAHDVAKSFNGVARLIPKSVGKENANPFLAALIIDTTDELDFKAGDLVKLEATIGDASQIKDSAGFYHPLAPSRFTIWTQRPIQFSGWDLRTSRFQVRLERPRPDFSLLRKLPLSRKTCFGLACFTTKRSSTNFMLPRCNCFQEIVYSILGSKSRAK